MIKFKAMEEWVKQYKWILVLLMITTALFLRVWQLPSLPPGLFTDEAVNGKNVLEAIHSGEYKVFYTDNNGREGLFINIQALFVQILGTKAWALRLPSALFGTLTVLGLYLLAKEMFKRESLALFAGFFLAINFWHINFSRIGFRAIMAPFFLVWGLWLVWLIASSIESSASKRWVGFLSVFGGIIFGLGFHSYIAFRVAPAILLPALWLLLRNSNLKGKRLLVFFLFCLGMFISILPLGIYFYQHPDQFFGRTSQISIFSMASPAMEFTKNLGKTVAMFFIAGDFNWRHNYAGAPELWYPVSALFLIGLLVSLKRLFKDQLFLPFKMAYLSLFIWLVVMTLPVAISSEGLPHALRAIILAPLVMIFAGVGLDWLASKISAKQFAILTIFIFVSLFAFTYWQYFIAWGKNPNTAGAFNKNLSEISSQLNSLPTEKEKYVLVEMTPYGPPMSYYPVMFLTNTQTEQEQKDKNIFYIPLKPGEDYLTPNDAFKVWIN